jgi:DNA-binding NtrC family response regulator
VVTLTIAPLRERKEDIPLLCKHFLNTFGKENNRENMRFNSEAMDRLIHARWDGNVRELRNLVESLVVLAPRDEIRVEDLPEEYRGVPAVAPDRAREGERPDLPPAATEAVSGQGSSVGLTMDEIERRAILEALEKTGGNRTQAAEMLGIGLRTLQRKLKEYREAGEQEAER